MQIRNATHRLVGQASVRAMITAAVLCACAADGSAQEIAFKAGFARSNLTPDQPGSLDGGTFTGSHVGTTFGGHYRWHLGSIALQPEISTVSRGAESGSGSEQIRLDYIEVPVLLVVPVRIGSAEVYGMAGPYLALESRCRYSEEQEGLKTSAGCEFVPTSFERRSLDWGAAAGVGASHRIGGGRLMLEARHAWGLRDIHDDRPELDVRNRTFTVTVGYTLRLDDLDERR